MMHNHSSFDFMPWYVRWGIYILTFIIVWKVFFAGALFGAFVNRCEWIDESKYIFQCDFSNLNDRTEFAQKGSGTL